jgi:biopolymer transport protein ExbD
MRRFSQRSHLVTLNEINITPLLDLAFVLLIIFIITTPLLEQGIMIKVPKGGEPDPQLRPGDFKTLELVRRNAYRFEGAQMDARQLWQRLVAAKRRNPSVIIFIRADRAAPFQDVFEVTDLCARLSLDVSFRSEPLEERR